MKHERDTITSGEITCLKCLDGSCPTQAASSNAETITGPCQIQTSILCEPSAGVQRVDPLAQAEPDLAFREDIQACQACYDQRADEFLRVTHGR